MISIQHISKSFGKIAVLQDVSLAFDQPGRITAVLGPNGSGKTTLIKCILGIVLPDAGDILLHGKSIRGEWAYRSQIDYLPQIARFPDNLTVQELILWIKEIRGAQTRDKDLIERFGLQHDLQKRLCNLSGGTRQKVNLVLTFMYDSPVLILDEPTSGLDPVAMLVLRTLIDEAKAAAKLILITTHIMSFVEEIADEVVFLLEGTVYFKGSIRELKTKYNESNVERAIAQMISGSTITTPNGHKQEENQLHQTHHKA